eukprot:1328746-Rhodomonas_salina.5
MHSNHENSGSDAPSANRAVSGGGEQRVLSEAASGQPGWRRVCVAAAPYGPTHMCYYGPILSSGAYVFLWPQMVLHISSLRCLVLLLWSLASPVLCPVLTQAYTPCIILCRSASAISLFSHAPAVHIVLLTRYAYGPRPKRESATRAHRSAILLAVSSHGPALSGTDV